MPVVRDSFPGVYRVATSDKVFSLPLPLRTWSVSYLAIESASKFDFFTDCLAASLGESSLEEAYPFTGSSFSLFDPLTVLRKVVVMRTYVSLSINVTQKCLAVLRQNLVS